MFFNIFNHNEKQNPHPQYDDYSFYRTSISTDTTKGYVKLIDVNVSWTTSTIGTHEDEVKGLQLCFIYRSDHTGIREFRSGLCDLSCVFTNDGVLSTSLIKNEYTNKDDVNFYLCNKLIDSDKKIYNVKLFAQLPTNYMDLKLRVCFFDSVKYSRNPYSLFKSSTENRKVRLDDLFDSLESNEFVNYDGFINQTINYHIITTKKSAEEITYTNGTSINITSDTTRVLLGASSTQIVNSITSSNLLARGKELMLVAYNGRVTLKNSGDSVSSQIKDGIILKDDTDVVIPTNGIIVLYYHGSAWVEVSRNFK